ncbi:MAG: hypothetical protein NZ839_04925 [Endomicrobia bacterium]|nr:hypothetical protein [Endomicrobiia bacterium]
MSFFKFERYIKTGNPSSLEEIFRKFGYLSDNLAVLFYLLRSKHISKELKLETANKIVHMVYDSYANIVDRTIYIRRKGDMHMQKVLRLLRKSKVPFTDFISYIVSIGKTEEYVKMVIYYVLSVTRSLEKLSYLFIAYPELIDAMKMNKEVLK